MKKFIVNLFAAANFGVIAYFWWAHSGKMLSGALPQQLIALGRITGLLAVCFVLIQFLLIGRIKWLEKAYGFDKLAILHHWTAFFALFFMFAHLGFLLFGYGARTQQNIAGQFAAFLGWEGVFAATVAIILFLVVSATSVIMAVKQYNYERWYFIHLASYAAIFLAFGHQLAVGADFINHTFAGYWWFLYGFVAANFIYYRFARQFYFFARHQFRVEKTEQENEYVFSIYITGKDLEKFKFEAGQFCFWRFLDDKRAWQAHPFSFSAAPNGKYLKITTKTLGDYTAKLSKVKIGTPVLIDGPHGVFTLQKSDRNKLLFIAGGVGITPILSILSTIDTQDAVLIYCNRTEKDIIFKKELLANKNLRVTHILSDEKNWSGECGYINEEKLRRLAPDILERDVYLCGPAMMMKMTQEALASIGVSKKRIFFEKFSFNK
jgi:predicted ferric reductase